MRCASTAGDSDVVTAMRSLLGTAGAERTVGLDAEWDTHTGQNGFTCSRSTSNVDVIQLAYKDPGAGTIKVLVLQTAGLAVMPAPLSALFGDSRLTFTGRNVGGDLSRIGRMFKCPALMGRARDVREELGIMARKRGVQRGSEWVREPGAASGGPVH